MDKLRIVFMGTPEFAVGILDSIVGAGYEVAGVVTAPDKPAGRGQKVRFSAVKEFAVANGLPVLQPLNLKDPQFLADLDSLRANLQVVVAFRMRPAAVWQMPQLGTFNLHASLLPQYRGAAPINWAIINGENKTGVTTFFIDDKIDTGAIILKKETPISPDEDLGSLHDRLMELGSSAVVETLALIETGNANPVLQQDSAELKTAPKLNRENTRIDFNRPVNEIRNLVRGLSPYPTAWTNIHDQGTDYAVKIYSANAELQNHSLPVGTIITEGRRMRIAASDGFVDITDLQFPGKKPLSAKDFLNGYPLSPAARAN